MVTGYTSFSAYNFLNKPAYSIEKGMLPCKIGIEYSCFHKDGHQNNLSKYIEAEKYIQTRPRELRDYEAIHTDDGVIEIPSPPHETYKEVITFYNGLEKLMKRFELVPWKEGEAGGGLHFHMDMPNLKITMLSAFLRDLFVDIANRPYLTWIFNEPHDIWNANSFFRTHASTRFIQKLNKGVFFDFNALDKADFWRKGKPIRYDSYTNTIEYRMFEMARSKEELVAMLNFICNYYEQFIDAYSNKTYREKVSLWIDRNTYNDKEYVKHYIESFQMLLNQLNLNYNNYEVFVERNFKTRIKWGKTYLV